MKKVIRISEADLTRIVRRVIQESTNSQQLVADAKAKMKTSGADQDTIDTIKKCIKENGLTHLAILTTGAGAYTLGVIAVLMGTGVGAPLALMASGAILIALEGIGIEGQGVADEVDKLLKCMGY